MQGIIMDIRTEKELEECIFDLVEKFAEGAHEATDGVHVVVVDDDTVRVEVVENADESDDEDVYPFADFVLYTLEDGKMLTDINAEYVADVASAYFPEN